MQHGLFFMQGDTELSAFSNADWVSSVEDRRLTSGYCIFLGSNLVA